MTARSLVRLPGLTALCLALAALVVATGERRGTVGRPALAPGLSFSAVTRITFERAGRAPIAVEIAADRMLVTAPVPGPADEAAVRDVISAVAAARADRTSRDRAVWRRAGLDAPRAKVRIATGATSRELRIGAAQPASEQTWLGVDGVAMLTPSWVAAALDRDLIGLRRRRPFAGDRVTGVEIHGIRPPFDLVLAGDPLVRRDDGSGARVATRSRQALLAALGGLELTELIDGPREQPVFTVRVLGGARPAELAVFGPCPGRPAHALVDGAAGVGCIPDAAIAAVQAAAAEIAAPAGVANSPLDGPAPRSISIARPGRELVALSRVGAAWRLASGSERVAADDDAVRELLEALARPATAMPIPSTPVDAVWTVERDDGGVELWEVRTRGRTSLRRGGEPHALGLDAPASAVIAAIGPGSLRSRTLLVVEPTAVQRIEIAGADPVRLERGVTLDRWTAISPPGAVATPAVEGLLETLATLRATRWLEPGELGPVRRTIAVTLDPEPAPGAESRRHVIELGDERRGGCAARVDADGVAALTTDDCVRLRAKLD